jgi:molybdopterin adenylyltransferase
MKLFIRKSNFMAEKVTIKSVNIATERGRKTPVKSIRVDETGIEGDVHNNSLRPVSMLDTLAVERFSSITGAKALEYGSFAENITFEPEHELDVKIFDRFVKDDLTLEVVFKGKPYHDQFRDPGHYLMPREGIFCRVIHGGMLQAGDVMEYVPKIFKIRVITLSDRAHKGVYEDRSGPEITGITEKVFSKLNWRFEITNLILPDDASMLEQQLKEAIALPADLIITTGGTGIGPRDITPEVVNRFIHKQIPGIIEMIRWKFGIEKPAALVSRAVAGANGTTLLFALPGSVKAVNEYMGEIAKHLEHLFYMVHAVELH